MGKRAAQGSLPPGELSDAFWAKAAPFIPMRQRELAKNYVRKPGGGRKPKDARLVFAAIMYVLRTGCSWKALPTKPYGGSTIVHKRFLDWKRRRVFEMLWYARLAEWDEMEGIPWRWEIINGAPRKKPLVQEAGGPNPTNVEKLRQNRPSKAGQRAWRPAAKEREPKQPAKRTKPNRPDVALPLIDEDRDQ